MDTQQYDAEFVAGCLKSGGTCSADSIYQQGGTQSDQMVDKRIQKLGPLEELVARIQLNGPCNPADESFDPPPKATLPAAASPGGGAPSHHVPEAFSVLDFQAGYFLQLWGLKHRNWHGT